MANPPYYQTSLVSQEREHLLHLYMYQDRSSRITTVNPGLPHQFGETVVIDYPVYDDIQPIGKVVARAQGLVVGAAMAERRWFYSFNLVFTDPRFSGSGLKVEGTWRIEEPNLEWAVVGGTGEFGHAQGTATYTSTTTMWDLHFRLLSRTLT